jgi:hypothetical protein
MLNGFIKTITELLDLLVFNLVCNMMSNLDNYYFILSKSNQLIKNNEIYSV